MKLGVPAVAVGPLAGVPPPPRSTPAHAARSPSGCRTTTSARRGWRCRRP